MATVYLARDAKHDRQVALKVLDPELGAVIGAERFLSEIRVTANLQHPNLLPLFDSGEADGLLFYVMPFVGGESLRSRIQREKQLPLDDAIRISVAVASAVDYAHRHGIVHRDLKPENVLLHDGEPMVADFGIALAVSNAGGSRITQTGISLGTPQYMSPEQATGDRAIDGRTDIYSLAAMTYEMLAGEPPHNAPTAQAVIAKLMTEEPRPVSALRRATPTYVDEALQRALEKLPADRFGTAREFADALQGKGAAPVLRAGAGLAGRPSRWNSLTVVACTVAVLATSAAFWAWTRAPRETDSFAYRVPLAFPSDTRINTSGPLTSFDISPDGKQLVYVGGSDRRLFIRRLDELTPRVLSDGPASTIMEMHRFGGKVAGAKGEPLADVWISMPEIGLFAATDAQGRFRLDRVPPGSHKLIARSRDGQEASAEVAVPGTVLDLTMAPGKPAKPEKPAKKKGA